MWLRYPFVGTIMGYVHIITLDAIFLGSIGEGEVSSLYRPLYVALLNPECSCINDILRFWLSHARRTCT